MFTFSQQSGFFHYTWPTLGPCPGCTCTPQPRWISKWRLLGAKFIMPWRYSLTFNPREDFLHICSVSLFQKGVGGSEDPLILYSNRALPLSVLAINYYLDYCRDYYFKVFVEYAGSFQSCPTLCDSMDYSPPGSSIHRIFQATLLWSVDEDVEKGNPCALLVGM